MNLKHDNFEQQKRPFLSGLRLAAFFQQHWHIPVYMSIVLFISSAFNAILFHTLIELFAIGIAIMSFVVSWNTFTYSRNEFLLYLGCGYFWIGIIDLFHTLSFQGLEVFTGLAAGATIEFWIIGRFLEAIILLLAPFTLTMKLRPKSVFLVLGLISTLALALVFGEFMPQMFIPGQGLTKTKIICEYIIIGILILSAMHLSFGPYKIDKNTKILLLSSIFLTVLAELCFTVYIGFNAPAILVGHIFKFLSFWAIYQALVESALTRPFESLSRVVNSYDSVSDATVIIDQFGIIQQANKIARGRFADAVIGKHCHDVLHPKTVAQSHCAICQSISAQQSLQDYQLYDESQLKWYEASLSPLHIGDNYSTMVHALREITLRKQSEEHFASLSRAYKVLSHTNQAITRIKDKKVLLKALCDIAVEHGALKMAWIGSIKNNIVQPDFFSGYEDGYFKTIRVTIDDTEWSKGPVGIAAKTNRISCVNDVLSDPDFTPWRAAAIERGYAALAAVPLFFDGKVDSIFTLYSTQKDVFDSDMRKLLTNLSDDISAALFNIHQAKLKAQAEDTIEQLAFYDPLTKLANRRLLMDRLDQAIISAQRHKEHIAVLLFDLDNFKMVNDSLGHDHGDQLLQHISSIMKSYVRAEDTVARLGGDEFTIVLSGIKGESCVIDIADKILNELENPIFLSGNQLVISSSIGIALYPQDGNKPEALLRNADLAMYHAKGAGKNRFQFFQQDMNIKAQGRLDLENKLRQAVKDESFELFYQPQVNISDTKIIGFEALVRWRDSQGNLIPPDVFIPLAEETGLIEAIGDWVIKQAFKDWKILHELGFIDIRMAVNVAAYQFRHADNLCAVIKEMLATYPKCPAERFTVELTEGTLIEDFDATIETLHTLKSLGISLSIDDFGTGYSSLNYLKRFPIDQLKIDKSFVQDLSSNARDEAIVTAIIAIAQKLNMKVIAEGVETETQAHFLNSHHCGFAQGYLYYKPMTLDQLKNL